MAVVCRSATRGSRLDVGDAFLTGLWEMFFVPGNGSVDGVDLMFDLGEAVPFARVANENRLHAEIFEGDEKLLRFGDRNIVVVLTVKDERGRMRGGDMLQGRPFPGHVHKVSLMQKLAKLHLFVLVVVRHVVVADEICDSGGRNGRLEFIGLGDEPIGKLAAVAHTLDPEALSINPQVAAHRRTDRVENILAFVAVLVAKNGIRKLLAVTGRAAIVHVEYGITVRGVDLVLEVEARSILSVRSAMNHDDERMLRRGRHADGPGEKGFHLESVVVADKSKGFNLG